jgi:hypothetical protein
MNEQRPKEIVEQQVGPFVRQVKRFEKVCATCGTAFVGGPRAKYCRPACCLKAWEQRQGEAGVQARRDRQRRYRERKRQQRGD